MRRFRNLSIIELWSALAAIGWAKALYWFNGELNGNPSYTVVLNIFATDTWEWIAFLAGSMQLIALFSGKYWPRMIAGGFSGWFWLCIGIAFYTSESGAPSWALYLSFGFGNIHSLIRASMHKEKAN